MVVNRERYTPHDVGPSPLDWEAPYLSEVSSLITNGSVGTATPYYTDETGVPYLYGTNVRANKLDPKGIRFVTEEFHEKQSKTQLEAGDLLTVQSGHIGETAVVTEEFAGSNCHALIVTRPKQEYVFSPYLGFYINSEIGKARLKGLEVGSTILHINTKDLKKFRVLLPPLPEQRKIAKILSTWDKAIATTEKLIAASKQQKKALMQQLLTGKKRLVNPETGKVFEGEWGEVRLIDTANKEKYSFTGGPFGSDLKSSDYTESGVRIIQLQNIGDGCFHNSYKIFTSEEKADELSSCNIFPEDIIISKMGDPVARATLIPDFHHRYVMASDGIRLAVDKHRFNNSFVLEVINFESFRNTALSKSTGSTRKRIGLTDLKNIKLRAPQLIEQKKIASVLTAADKEIELHQTKLAHFKQEKKALMQQLLTGKRRVKVEEEVAA